MPNRLRSRLTLQGCKTVGQFLRLTPKEIKEIPGAGAGTVQAAEAVIISICGINGIDNREEPIEIEKLINNVPVDRKMRYVAGYIQAFSDDKHIRESLFQSCSSDEMTVDGYFQVGISNNMSQDQADLFFHFYSWLSFNLEEEIKTISEQMFSNEREMKIVTMRANKKTLQDVGNELNITRERVRQIEKKIREKFIKQIHAYQIIKKIYAERNQDKVLTGAELSEFFGDNAVVFLYFLRGVETADYEYDEDLDVFIVEDRELIDRVQEFMETLPETIAEKNYNKYVLIGIENYGLNKEIIDAAIKERYKFNGNIYHRSRLRLSEIYELILNEYYPEGIHVYDSEEIASFRKRVKEEYGEVTLPKEDHAIATVITRVGILCNRGVYKPRSEKYISKELENKIRKYIDDSDA